MFGNDLLETFVDHSYDLKGRLTPVDFIQGDVLATPGSAIDTLVFPLSGMISIVVELEGGQQIEAGIIGRRGALGGGAVLGATHHPHKAVCQLSGRCWAMAVADATELTETSDEFRHLLVAQEQYLLAQARQFAACNASHRILQRLCSWLLRVQEETAGGELGMTQENVARMLGVQRATLSLVASELQQEGLVSYRRGRIWVDDLQGLRDRACACHGALTKQHELAFRAGNNRRDGHRGSEDRDLSPDGPRAG
jgi:CRP-like cAMP-binding protein